MDQEQSFIAAICAAPEDDALRLVYADWLEEHGQQARAEFIRVQVRLANLAEGAPERPALTAREHKLLTQHEAEWTAPLRRLGARRPYFQRGLVYSLTVSGAKFPKNAERLFGLAPL